MASLDIDSILQGINPDSPCGDDLEYDSAFIALEQKSKETPEIQIGDKIVVPYQPPNWKEVRRDVIELLGRTLDLRILLLLVRANLSLDGIEGLKQSLSLLQGSIQLYWDTIHPQLDPDDDNDPTFRVNILESLCDSDSVLKMLSNAPLVESRAIGRFSLRQIQIATGKLTAPSGEESTSLSTIQAAFTDADPQHLQETRDALQESLNSVNEIERLVTVQVGIENAPSLTPLRTLLKEALHVFDEFSGTLAGATNPATDLEPAPASSQVLERNGGVILQTPSVAGAVNTRQDVIKALDLICDYYAKFEPSSPVPLLARRAKRLVNMDFMGIMNDLAPDGLSQVELIKGHEPTENEE